MSKFLTDESGFCIKFLAHMIMPEVHVYIIALKV